MSFWKRLLELVFRLERIFRPFKRRVRPGKNARCPCGSGKKYKKCHLNADRNRRTSNLNVGSNKRENHFENLGKGLWG